jgi:hypothetical protein
MPAGRDLFPRRQALLPGRRPREQNERLDPQRRLAQQIVMAYNVSCTEADLFATRRNDPHPTGRLTMA